MNICDGELPQLAGAAASCVDLRICLSHRSAGPQCCAAQQNCKASWLSSHQNITLLPHKLLAANTWAPQCSGNKGKRNTTAAANGGFELAKWTWEKFGILLGVLQQFDFLISTKNEEVARGQGSLGPQEWTDGFCAVQMQFCLPEKSNMS